MPGVSGLSFYVNTVSDLLKTAITIAFFAKIARVGSSGDCISILLDLNLLTNWLNGDDLLT